MSPRSERLLSHAATREQIFARVSDVLIESFDLTPDQVRPESHLVDDLDLDSIDAIDLIFALEEETGLAVSESELKAIQRVRDIVELMHAKLADRGRPDG